MIKKVMAWILSVVLLINGTFIYAAPGQRTPPPSDVPDMQQDTGTINLPGQGTNQPGQSGYDETKTPSNINAECYFYYDPTASERCYQLYEQNGPHIDRLMSEPAIFPTCIKSNCGKYYVEDPSRYNELYSYQMERVKKCKLVAERTLQGNELAGSKWITSSKASLTQEADDKGEPRKKVVPYKLLQYKCPSYKEVKYQTKERVLQYPVLCRKPGASASIFEKISKCLEKQQNCDKLNKIDGGIGRYIFWQYCDKDTDGDGFPESLSDEQVQRCNRSDAASLKCKKNSMCTVTAKCKKESNISAQSSYYRECKNLKRAYEDHVVNTKCGEASDIYQENPNCVRINTITDGRSENPASYRTYKIRSRPAGKQLLDDYQEYVVYRKGNGETDTYFAALFFPKAIYIKKSGLTLLGKLAFIIGGWYIGGAIGAIGGAIAGNLLKDSSKIPATIIDNHVRKALDRGKLVSSNPDIKGITYRVHKKRGLFKKKTEVWMQKAYWDNEFVDQISSAEPENHSGDWLWGDGTWWTPFGQKYSFRIKLTPSDILVMYNFNTRSGKYGFPEAEVLKYEDTDSCEQGVFQPGATWYKFIDQVPPTSTNSRSVHDMALFLPYPSVYKFLFYDGDTLLSAKTVNLGYVTDPSGGRIRNADIATFQDDGWRNEEISRRTREYILSHIEQLAEQKALSDPNLVTYTNAIQEKLMLANNDRFKDKDKDWRMRNYVDENDSLYQLFFDNFVEHYIDAVNKGERNDICAVADSVSDGSGVSENEILGSTETTDVAGYNTDFGLYKECLIQNEGIKEELRGIIDNKLNDLRDMRFHKVIYYTNQVIEDRNRVKNYVDSILNKPYNRYSTTTSQGSYTASFKSACGDYVMAQNTVNRNFLNSVHDISRTYYHQDLSYIKDNIMQLIDGHMQNVTIKYGFTVYYKDGTSKYDLYHNRVPGHYSCEYTEPCSQGECTKTESGECFTHGVVGNRCRAQCEGYHGPYWGSEYDDNGDVPDDWDKVCSGSYIWYETHDNYGTGGYKIIKGRDTRSFFSSWGGYSCDNFGLISLGDENSKCNYNGHDQVDDYDITTSERYWTSIAKRNNSDVNTVRDEEERWMVENRMVDGLDVSANSYWGEHNKVRLDLSTDDNGGIARVVNSEMWTPIRNRVFEILKDRYYQRYMNFYRYNITGDPDFDQVVQEASEQAINSVFNGQFQPFNRVVIKDMLADETSPYAVDHEIKVPGGLKITNPNSLSIYILPQNEVRKYRCYKEYQKCPAAHDAHCELDSAIEHTFVTDMFGKRVPTLKNETYRCTRERKVAKCEEWDYKMSCVDFNNNVYNVDFDDNDYTKDFYKGVGQTFAFNEAVKLFGAEQLRCERGIFTDFSWLQDPMFWLNAIMSIASQYPGFNNAIEALKGWAAQAVGLSGTLVGAGKCAQAWATCMNSEGAGLMDAVQGLFGQGKMGTEENYFKKTDETCTKNTRNITDCKEFASETVSEQIDKLNENFQNALPINLSDPITQFLLQIAYQLLFNTFDKCNQCVDKECAEAHDPKEAIRLLKKTNAKAQEHSGIQYGLGEGFKAYNMCFFKRSGCAAKILGHCYRHYEEYCCYDGVVARILVGQMYQQNGWTFKEQGCSRLHVNDLFDIDFTPCPEGTVPSISNKCINYAELTDYIMHKVNWDTQGYINTNTMVNAVINATSTYE